MIRDGLWTETTSSAGRSSPPNAAQRTRSCFVDQRGAVDSGVRVRVRCLCVVLPGLVLIDAGHCLLCRFLGRMEITSIDLHPHGTFQVDADRSVFIGSAVRWVRNPASRTWGAVIGVDAGECVGVWRWSGGAAMRRCGRGLWRVEGSGSPPLIHETRPSAKSRKPRAGQAQTDKRRTDKRRTDKRKADKCKRDKNKRDKNKAEQEQGPSKQCVRRTCPDDGRREQRAGQGGTLRRRRRSLAACLMNRRSSLSGGR